MTNSIIYLSYETNTYCYRYSENARDGDSSHTLCIYNGIVLLRSPYARATYLKDFYNIRKITATVLPGLCPGGIDMLYNQDIIEYRLQQVEYLANLSSTTHIYTYNAVTSKWESQIVETGEIEEVKFPPRLTIAEPPALQSTASIL